MALDYLHTGTGQDPNTVTRLGLAHRRVRDLSSRLGLLNSWSNCALLIHLWDSSASVWAWWFLPSSRSTVVRYIVTLSHHRVWLQWKLGLSQCNRISIFVMWVQHWCSCSVLDRVGVEWGHRVVLIWQVCRLHLHERWLLQIYGVAVWIDDSQVVVMVSKFLNHLGILINYLRPPSSAHSLSVVLLAKNGSHGLRKFLWASWLHLVFLDAHVRKIVLRDNLMHLWWNRLQVRRNTRLDGHSCLISRC